MEQPNKVLTEIGKVASSKRFNNGLFLPPFEPLAVQVFTKALHYQQM